MTATTPNCGTGCPGLALHGLIVPERFGGAGLGILDAAVAAEGLGYAAAPVPFAGTTVMAPLAFMNRATEAQQDEYLPMVAAGEARIAVGFAGLSGQTGAASATLDGTGLTGRVSGVMDAGAATHFLIYLRDGTAALVEASGLAITRHRSLDRTRPLVDVSFNATPAVLLAAANDKLAAARKVLDAGRVALAADTLGSAQTMLDRAVAFAKERVQFGRVIGSFQGVKYMLADCVTTLEPCRGMVWYAAHAQDAMPDEARLTACHVKAHICDVAREVARLTTETHGGMGFTDLLGLHYWFKRIGFNRQVLGGPDGVARKRPNCKGGRCMREEGRCPLDPSMGLE